MSETTRISAAAGPRGPRAVVERMHRLAAEYDLTGQAELYAQDGVLEWPFAPSGAPRRIEGREQIRRVLGSLQEAVRSAGTRRAAITSVATHQTVDPEVVIVELEVHGEIPASGASYDLPYIQVFRVRDGQILLFRDYFGPGTAAALEAAFRASGSDA